MPISATTARPNDWPVRIRRRPDVVPVEQRYGERRYWVLKDPVAWRYVKLSELEYAIWQTLDGHVSLRQIQESFETQFAPLKVSEPQLHAFLGELHRKGLVLADAAGQGTALLGRDAQRRWDERVRMLGGVLALRFRGINPDPVLDRLYGLVYPLFSPVALLSSLLVVLAALVLVAVQFDVLRGRLPQFSAFFQATNVVWIAAALAGTKILHELGHGLTCRHFGARCHELGVMMLVFVPCLYCNVSDAWTLPNKWHRIAVTAAGVWVELVLAAVCTFVWWFSEPGWLNTLSLNTMFVCSVSTLLFNGNPLLRYDGYYVLADWLEVPNLWQQSRGYLTSLVRRFHLGVDVYDDLAWRTEPRQLLVLYGLASIAYRWIVLVAILLFVFRFFEPYRLEIVAWSVAVLVLAGTAGPPIKQGWQWMKHPGNRRRIRWGRFASSALVVFVATLALALTPVPFRVTAPLVLEPADARRVYVPVSGELDAVPVVEGQQVAAGEELARLRNLALSVEVLELEGEVEREQARLDGLQARRAFDPDAALQIPASQEVLADLRGRLDQRREEVSRLVLRAPIAGTIIPPPELPKQPAESGQLPDWTGTPLQTRNLGSKLESGTLFCLIGDPQRLEATLYIDQSEIEYVHPGQRVRLRFDSLPGRILEGELVELARMDAKIAPRELMPQDLPVRAGADGVMRPLQTPYQARVRLDDHPYWLPVGARGQARVQVGSLSLGSRIYRLVQRTFHFDRSTGT